MREMKPGRVEPAVRRSGGAAEAPRDTFDAAPAAARLPEPAAAHFPEPAAPVSPVAALTGFLRRAGAGLPRSEPSVARSQAEPVVSRAAAPPVAPQAGAGQVVAAPPVPPAFGRAMAEPAVVRPLVQPAMSSGPAMPKAMAEPAMDRAAALAAASFAARPVSPQPVSPQHVSPQADPAAAARYWTGVPAAAPEPAAPYRRNATPARALDDADDGEHFRPWLLPDPDAGLAPVQRPAMAVDADAARDGREFRDGWQGTDATGRQDRAPYAASPRLAGNGIAAALNRAKENGIFRGTASGPWAEGWQAPASGGDPADGPGWDDLYAEDAGDQAAYFTSADDRQAPPAPAGRAPVQAAPEIPEAPMVDARPARRDPAPSRTAYRLQRMWLTPLYQALLRKGVPAFVVIFGIGMVLQNPEQRARIAGWGTDIRAAVTERPEFMVTRVAISGASEETEAAVRGVLDVTLPVSSFDLELADLQKAVAGLSAVASASVQVRAGGVLAITVEERRPAVVWRSDEGIGTLDNTGQRVASLANRLDRPDLPLLVGTGAETAVPEALRVYVAAGPVRERVRGLIRVSERRWDLIVEPSIRVMLPATDPVRAVEQVVALHQAQALLDRDIVAIDMRNPARATVRMGEPAAETYRLNVSAQRGEPTR